MEVPLTPDQEAQLHEIAMHSGLETDELTQRVFERFLAFEARESEALRLGIEQADRGDLLDHDDVVAAFERRRSV